MQPAAVVAPGLEVFLKIVVTGLRGMPGVMGGVESHCDELLPRLKALRPQAEIVVLGRTPYVGARPVDVAGITVKGMPTIRSASLEAITGTFTAILHARALRADLLHIHAIGPAVLAPLARLLGIRVIVTHHGADYNRGKWGRFAKTMLRLGERAALRFARVVICVSPSLERTLAAAYPHAQAELTHIPNGVPSSAGEPDPAADAQADEVLARHGMIRGKFLLAVGRLVPEKGFETLIEAVRRLPGEPRLLIVGGSEHRSDYADCLLGLADDRIRFAGAVPRVVVHRLYAAARMFVLPSLHEGLPISALEAARFGAPMLLSDIDANLDLGLPSGNYFPAGDADTLTQRLSNADRIPAVDGAALCARFDWDRIAAATLAAYDRVLDETVAPRPEARNPPRELG
jgi:glycosyltransferase involved in cell wall biosynthesis